MTQLRYFISLGLLCCLIYGCNETLFSQKVLVTLHTPKGAMKVLLHEQTPKHRKNFIKLAKEGVYDSTTFYRVIHEFMIQGGDLARVNKQQELPMMDAEIVPELFHRKGAVVAVRQGGVANPQRKSDGSQFYIVQGRKHTLEELKEIEREHNYKILAPLMAKLLNSDKHLALKAQVEQLSLKQEVQKIKELVLSKQALLEQEFGKQNLKHFSTKQQEVYTTEGGLPMLDGEYTVFGQVVEGMETLDSLAGVSTNYLNRPIKPIIFTASTEKISSEEFNSLYEKYIEP